MADKYHQPICLGDLICLYDEDRHGYITSYQTSEAFNEVVLGADQSNEFPILPNCQAAIFEVSAPMRYKTQKRVAKLAEALKRHPRDVGLISSHAAAQSEAENEISGNVYETERLRGKQVLYGQTIQLRHIFTNKWLHCSTIQISQTECNSMAVDLRKESSRSAQLIIVPRSKIKTEGDVVRVTDVVVLESIKIADSGIRTSRFAFSKKQVYADSYEINLSPRPSGYIIYRFSQPPKKRNDEHQEISGGSMIRLFHREVEGYLTVEGLEPETGEEPHLRLRPIISLEPKTTYPSTSAITYWQIEHERGPTCGDTVVWEEFVRLRHVLNRMYLMVTSDKKIAMTADNLDSSTLFRFHAVVKHSSNIGNESVVRIENVKTGVWLHGDSTKVYYTQKQRHRNSGKKPERTGLGAAGLVEDLGTIDTIPWSNAQLRQITCSSQMQYDDAFSIQLVYDQNLNEVNYVAGMVPFLKKLGHDISKGIAIDHRATQKIHAALTELTNFVYIDQTPCKRRQKLLRNFMIVDIAVQILKLRRTQTTVPKRKEPTKQVPKSNAKSTTLSVPKSRTTQSLLSFDATSLADGGSRLSGILPSMYANREVPSVAKSHAADDNTSLMDGPRSHRLTAPSVVTSRSVEQIRADAAPVQPAAPSLEIIYSDLLVVLRAYVDGESRKNELYLSRHIDFFLSQIGDTKSSLGLTATQMTVDLMQNNRKLVDRISLDQTESICALVAKNRNYRYLELLTCLCICDEAAITRNQNFIADQLLSRRRGEAIFVDTQLGHMIGKTQNTVYVRTSVGQDWRTVPESINLDEDFLKYFKHQLMLFEALCNGRNAHVVKILTVDMNIVTWEICYLALTDSSVNDEIRAVYCKLLYNTFINVGNNFVREKMQMVYNYMEMRISPEGENQTFDSSDDERLELPFVDALKEWINGFLVENDSMVAARKERNTLISEVLVLVRNLALLGYYSDFTQIKAVLEPIIGLLDGADDLPFEEPTDADASVLDMIETYQKTGRYKNNSQNASLAVVKINACHATELLFNLRASQRLCSFLVNFKRIRDQEVFTPYLNKFGDMLYGNYNRSDHKTNALAMAFLYNLVNETDSMSVDLTQVLLDLARYENQDIVAAAMFLVHKSYSNFDDLFKAASQAQLLITDKSLEAQATIATELREVQLMLADRNIDEENGWRLVVILDKFSQMCYQDQNPHNECHPINQQILVNYGIMADVFDIITGSIETEQEALSCVRQSCFELLKAVSRNNAEAQKLLYDRLETLLRTEGTGDYVAELFIQVFTQSTALRLNISQEVIQLIVSEMTNSLSPTLCRLLTCLVANHDQPLKRNQELVVNALWRHRISLAFVTDCEPEELVKLMAADSSNDKQIRDQQMYLCNMVQLVAKCCKGGHKTMESIAQRLFSLSNLLEIILLPNICNGIRAPFVEFLHIVFFKTMIRETTLADIANEPKIWLFFDSICEKILEMKNFVLDNKRLIKCLLRKPPLRNHVDIEQTEHEHKETLFYIMNALLPFITTFFKQHADLLSHGGSDDQMDTISVATVGTVTDLTAGDPKLEMARVLRNYLFASIVVPFSAAIQSCLSQQWQVDVLNDCIEVLALGEQKNVGRLKTKPIGQDDTDPLACYILEYAEEQRLNAMLCNFVQNLRTIYCGENTARCQIDYPSDQEYSDQQGDCPLPLNSEFQQLVRLYTDEDKSDPMEKYANTEAIIRHLENTMRMNLDTELKRVRMKELNIVLLKVLRALIHNNIIKSGNGLQETELTDFYVKQLEEVQESLTKNGIIHAILLLFNCSVEEWAIEAMGLCVALLHGANKQVQKAFFKFFLSTSEELFFVDMRQYIAKETERLHESRIFFNQEQEKGRLVDEEEEEEAPVVPLWKRFLKAIAINRKRKSDIERPMLHRPGATIRHDCKSGQESDAEATEQHLKQLRYQGRISLVLRIIGGLCDGQNKVAQDYIRDQWDNIKNVNLVDLICSLLPIVAHSAVTKVDLIAEIIDNITETVLGNENNQMVVFNSKIMDTLNFLMRVSRVTEASEVEEQYSLKKSIGDLLKALTEENTLSQHTKLLMAVVDKDELFTQMTEAYDLLDIKLVAYDDDLEDLVIQVGFQFHHLLQRAIDLDPSFDWHDYKDSDAWDYFASHTMSVELLKDNILQRVYFMIDDENLLRSDVKESMKWEIDRSSPSNKLRDFMEWASAVCNDIRYQRRVQSWMMGRVLVSNWPMLNIIMLIISMMLNLVVLFGWVAPESFDTDYHYSVPLNQFYPVLSDQMLSLIRLLGLFHIIFCFFLLLSFLLSNRPILPKCVTRSTSWLKKKIFRKNVAEQLVDSESTNEMHDRLGVKLFSAGGLYYPLLLALSVMGTGTYGEFFAIHLLHIANQNQLLRRVIQSVTLNGRSMLYVVLLGLIFFYIYALIGFLFLRNVFVGGDALYCSNFYECLISTLRNGLMYGMADNFELQPTDPRTSFPYYAYKAIYDISFFALITTIGLNMIFGITIDTFSELRGAKSEAEQDMRTTCFICNRQSYEFEHVGITFKDHIKKEHNMWSYLFFFIHLSDIARRDMGALELYVYKIIERNGTDFFPLGNAIALAQAEFEKAEDKRLKMLVKMINFVVERKRNKVIQREHAKKTAEQEEKKRAAVQGNGKYKLNKRDRKKREIDQQSVYGPFPYKVNN